MKSCALIVLAVVTTCLESHAQLILRPGDIYMRGLDSLPLQFTGPDNLNGRSLASFSLIVDEANFEPGSSFRMDFTYGGTISGTWSGPGSITSMVGVGGSGRLGGLALTGLSGSVAIQSISLNVTIPQSLPDLTFIRANYGETFAPVPEPAASNLLLFGCAVAAAAFRTDTSRLLKSRA